MTLHSIAYDAEIDVSRLMIFETTRNGPIDTGRKLKRIFLVQLRVFMADDDEVQHIKIALFSFIAFITVCSTVCYMK
jgi:hypothetical protein